MSNARTGSEQVRCQKCASQLQSQLLGMRAGLAKLTFVHTLSEQMAFFDFRAYPKNIYEGDETKAAGRIIFNEFLVNI